MPADLEDGTLLQCFVAVAHVGKMMGWQLLLASPRSTNPPMSIGAWIVGLSATQPKQVLSQPASLQWLEEPNADGVVGFIESLALTLHVCVA
jgi:hypothetical protein